MGQEGGDIDHYEVLRLPSGEEGAALSVEQIEKAYRSQSRLRHPDRRPDDPNATADFQRLASSYNVLKDESLRRQLDARLRSRREAAARAAASGVKRRKAASDLEERERACAARGSWAVGPAAAIKRDEQQKAEAIKRELDGFFTAKRAAASAIASTSAHEDRTGKTPENEAETDKVKILKVSWDGAADYYTAAKLKDIFRHFGKVEDIVTTRRKSKRRGSAIVVMASEEAALSAIQNRSVHYDFSVPLTVTPFQESSGSPARSTQTSEPRTSNFGGIGFMKCGQDLQEESFGHCQHVYAGGTEL